VTGKSQMLLTLYPLACWSWILAIIAFGSIFLNFSNRLLKYASQAVLPVYILHQTIIVVAGYYVIQLETGVMPKYFLVVLTTLAISLAIYEVARRTNVTRFLFGMKGQKSKRTIPVLAEPSRAI
jgi:glucan biosynthesis protein C